MSEQAVQDWIRKTDRQQRRRAVHEGHQELSRSAASRPRWRRSWATSASTTRTSTCWRTWASARASRAFSQWPTIPQLYVKGEFVGGCDIVREMFQQGELQQLFDEKGVAYDKARMTA